MKFYKRTDPEGTTTTVESYSHDSPVEGATEITEKEHDDYLAGLPVPDPEQVRDLVTEFDQLTAELKEKGVIP